MIKLKRLHPDAIIPTRATQGSAGLDLYACIDVHIPEAGRALIPTGWAIAIPHGYEGQVRPRSGLALRDGLAVLNSPGTIDSDYRGELCVLLVNHGSRPVAIKRGDRIAQLVVAPVSMIELAVVDDLPRTERGSGGFGSTG